MGKIERVNGNTRNVLEKLKGIKADLVRGEDGWQDWDLPRLVVALKKWRDINESANLNSNDDRSVLKQPGRRANLYYAKDGDRKKRACVYCNERTHVSKDCKNVASVTERKKFLVDRKLCFNCTGAKHRASDCKSTATCQVCNGKHHTSICEKLGQEKLLTASENHVSSVYPVVVVNVGGTKCRALLDTGAGSSYASATLLNRLRTRDSRRETRRIEMMLKTVTREVELSTVNVQSLDGKFNMDVSVTKVDKPELLHVDNPHHEQLISTYSHLNGIIMDDNDRKPKLPIHLILGASDYVCIKTNQPARVGKTGEPVAEMTKFGWTIIAKGREIDYTALLLAQTNQSDYEQLCRLDVLGLVDRPENDQETVYAEFREQLVRSEEGWYETGLPWKGNHPTLLNNKTGSLQRLSSLTKRLKKSELSEAYDEIINGQIKEGIVEVANEPPVGKEFYIPHKPVVRESAESTKLRIVYDASAKAHPDAPSLNDCLNAGPPLQNHLWDVLVRMRFHPVAVTGDLKKAFLQVRIKEEDRDSLRFHWQPTETRELQTLRFTRALFGLTCSPFLLGGVIEHHLSTWEDRRPEEVSELRKSMYVDDLVSGGKTVEEAKKLKTNATEIFNDATFTLHKWHSNEPELEDPSTNLAAEVTYAKQQLGATRGEESSLLGLPWDKSSDTISIATSESATPTKRGTLQKLAKIYDPLGLISPQTLQGKLVYREICKNKIGWDAEIDDEVKKKLERWERDLPKKVAAKRSLVKFRESIESIELHGFGDASGDGVSSAVYAIVRQPSGVSQGLVAAKSRLSKQGLTIPRLELVSAHMTANLLSNVETALKGFPITVMQAWLDSTVALHWINGGGEYKQFVANRIQKIKSHSRIQWRHVPTDQNPADLGSRGGSVENKNLWWNGPEWIKTSDNWPANITIASTKESNAEAKVIKQVLAVSLETTDELDEILTKHDLWRTLRVTAWIARFAFNARHPRQKLKGPLTTSEIENQKEFWTKRAQSSAVNKAEESTLNLQPNELGVLVCQGRIQGSFPVFLPDCHPFATKLVEQAHMRTLHGGVGMTMAHIREKYWIPRLRRLARKVIKKCYGCRRFQAKALKQPAPGLLPRDRTEGNRPFQTIGVDFAGPLRYRKTNKTEGKAYIVLYACSLTRGIYIELLSSLSTEEFIRSLKQFIARKGRPDKIYSDNGKTFVAAAKWLSAAQRNERLQNLLAEKEIHWQFNLSRAPWWGGQFKRLIGLVKRALQKTIGGGCLRLNEMKEVFLDVEVALNNRPLSYVEEDVQMPTLTPNSMIFVGSNELPELEAHHHREKDLRKRARFLSKCKDAVWRRWTTEYLRALRERHNQSQGTRETQLKIGDVVIIKSDEKNRAKWQLGIVHELYKGRDGVVRAVKLRAGKIFMERSPTHLYPLELSCDREAKEPQVSLNPDVAPFRPRRDAAVAARQRIQDEANFQN